MENDVFGNLAALMAESDYEDVNAESNARGGFEDLPAGYYLCEVETAELTTSKTSGNPMVKFRFSTVEDGIAEKTDENGDTYLTRVEHTTNRKIFKNYVLTTKKQLDTFVSDMLKFEGEVAGEPLIGKEYFTSPDLLQGLLDSGILAGLRLYIQVSYSEDKQDPSKKNQWSNPISFARATKLGIDTLE